MEDDQTPKKIPPESGDHSSPREDRKPDAEAGYKVGYGKPPKGSRFQKGKSGNPRGRPLILPPQETPSQIEIDFRTLARQPVRLSIEGKSKEISASEAVMRSIIKNAINGKVGAQRQCIEMLKSSYALNESLHEHVRILSNLDAEVINSNPELRAFWSKYIREVGRKSRNSK